MKNNSSISCKHRVPPYFGHSMRRKPTNKYKFYKESSPAPSDMPQVTIHFRHRSTQSLEFMVNLVRPASEHSVTLQATTLPPSVRFFPHFSREIELPFPREACCFSLFLPTRYFNEHHTVNLLQARNCVVQHLQHMMGHFRDYNGGLFETQRGTFENVAAALADKIPHFSLFANKVFHALQPVEARFSLSLQELEKIFRSISSAISTPSLETYTFRRGRHLGFQDKTTERTRVSCRTSKAKRSCLCRI